MYWIITVKLEKEGCMIAMTSHEDHQMVTIMSHKMENSSIYNWYRNGHVEMMEFEDFEDVEIESRTPYSRRKKRQTLKEPHTSRPRKLPRNMELVLDVKNCNSIHT